MLLRSVSTRREGGVDSSISSDHVIAEKVGAVDCEDELGPAVGAGGLEGDGQGEVPDNPEYKKVSTKSSKKSYTYLPAVSRLLLLTWVTPSSWPAVTAQSW